MMEIHEVSAKQEFQCPYCDRSFSSYQARNSHQGKCSGNPAKYRLEMRYDSIFRINERIRTLRAELSTLYSLRNEMFKQAMAEFDSIKEQMGDVR